MSNEKMNKAFEAWHEEGIEETGTVRPSRDKVASYLAVWEGAWQAATVATVATQRDAMAVAEAVRTAMVQSCESWPGIVEATKRVDLAAIVEAVRPGQQEAVNQQMLEVARNILAPDLIDLLPEEYVAKVKAVIDAADATQSAGMPVLFYGIDPLEPIKGATLPMIPDSWRFGFIRTDAGLAFCAQDNGPFVAWDAVKDKLAIDQQLLTGLKGAARLLRASGYAMSGTITDKMLAAIAAAEAAQPDVQQVAGNGQGVAHDAHHVAACCMNPCNAAAADVLAERRRQVEAEGWTPEHDDEHVNDELTALAAFYAMPPAVRDWPATETGYGDTFGDAILPADWIGTTGDRRRELVKAGALILAEIERLDRAVSKQEGGEA